MKKLNLFITLHAALFISFNLNSQTNTNSSGNWSNGSIWTNGLPTNNSIAYVNHSVNLDQSLSVGNGNYTFNAPVTSTLNSISTWGNGEISFNAKGEVNTVSLNNNFSLYINACDTVVIHGSLHLSSNASLYVSDCSVLIIKGNLSMHNNSDATINGIVYVNGSITATSNATADGNGAIQSNGQTNIWNNSNFFGNGTGCLSGCIYGNGSGLPIELKSFDAKLNDIDKSLIEVKWTTLSEINNNYFVLEYSSDGQNFQEIERIKGAGNSNIELNYSHVFKLNNVNRPTHYLRLKQVDFDGISKTFPAITISSNTIKANFSTDAEVKIYPNPSNGENLTILLENFISGQYELLLINTKGQILLKKNIQLNDKESSINLLERGDKLSKGIYFVRIQSPNESITKKLIIK